MNQGIRSAFTAHPRSRGENPPVDACMLFVIGSSPLTRGKRGRGSTVRWSRGLIPAHAGKTPQRLRAVAGHEAHPRSRGENQRAQNARDGDSGSSPLTRGKPRRQPHALASSRLIPAHAGKTRRKKHGSSSSKAHPRSRGENALCRSTKNGRSGSSPLTRGKPFLTCAFIAQIDQILESLELCASSGSYSLMDAYATDAPQDRVRSIGLAPLSSRGAS